MGRDDADKRTTLGPHNNTPFRYSKTLGARLRRNRSKEKSEPAVTLTSLTLTTS